MTKRGIATFIILSLVTCYIYTLMFWVSSKDEMNARGADIPTAWLLIVPLANFYWLWKWSEGVEKVTGGSQTAVSTFLMNWLCGFAGIGPAMTQSAFNKLP